MTGYIQGLIDEIEELNKKRNQYNELIFAVESKYKGETRHQTALRYIVASEMGITNAKVSEWGRSKLKTDKG